jgi:hypothetical protein
MIFLWFALYWFTCELVKPKGWEELWLLFTWPSALGKYVKDKLEKE